VTAPLLSLRGIGVRFPQGGWPRHRFLRAAHAVDLDVGRGEIVALVGESGSGKSTLGRVVARLQEAHAGQLLLDGVDVLRSEPGGASLAYRRRVQLVFQDPFASLNPVHPVGHGVARSLLLHGHATAATVRERVQAGFAAVGLGKELVDRHPYALSGGQRQRVAIARALAVEPELIVADEPTSMLDVSVRTDVLRLFRRLADAESRAVLLVTHDLASARLVSDRAVVLYAGRVMESGPAARVLAEPRHPYARLLAAASRRHDGLAAPLPGRPGTPPVVDPPPGCPFAARCPEAIPACTAADAPVVAVAPDHLVHCHRAEPA